MQVADASVEPGSVTNVLRSGYVIHERVLRAAQVAVATRPRVNSEGDTDVKAGSASSGVDCDKVVV